MRPARLIVVAAAGFAAAEDAQFADCPVPDSRTHAWGSEIINGEQLLQLSYDCALALRPLPPRAAHGPSSRRRAPRAPPPRRAPRLAARPTRYRRGIDPVPDPPDPDPTPATQGS